MSVSFNRKTLRFDGITNEMMDSFKSIYRDVDIQNEINKMCLWMQSDKGLNRKGSLSFITSWLQRAKPVTESKETLPFDGNPKMNSLLNNYLEDLWKDCRHILEFNTIYQ